jgi:two-component system cell cycle response regulator DivK
LVDGLEATRRLKADLATSDIPIIALTAQSTSGSREKALAAGCDDFNTKPVDFDQLLLKISRLLESSAEPDHRMARSLAFAAF